MKTLLNNRFSLGLILGFSFYFTSCVNTKENNSSDLDHKIMKIEHSSFGVINGENVSLYSLENKNGMKVNITNYGGIVTSLMVPDRDGKYADVVLGFDNLDGYKAEHPYFGCIVGRYGNRIANGEFDLDDESYTLAKNIGENHLHGGVSGFDKKLWQAEPFEEENEVGVMLSYISKDLEEGYPGNLKVVVSYILTNENELKITYEAETDKASPVNLTHHGYFNLTGGKENVLGHQIKINADQYVAVDDGMIPTGDLREVAGTEMDFLDYHSIGERIQQVNGGYDHSYVINNQERELILSAEVFDPKSGRAMEVYTTEPAVQFYTGNFLDGSLTGKNGVVYDARYGFCLEAQHYPDSPNQPSFPSTILRPGEKYSQVTIYKFSTI